MYRQPFIFCFNLTRQDRKTTRQHGVQALKSGPQVAAFCLELLCGRGRGQALVVLQLILLMCLLKSDASQGRV